MKCANQLALEAGNSPSVIFKNYRELATGEQAAERFGILPKDGQWENSYQWDHRARIVTLPGQEDSRAIRSIRAATRPRQRGMV